MMKNKICTSLEQSQKLIELGIDVNTADMFWDTLFAKKPEAQVDNHHLIDEYDDEHRVPAWSISTLLEIIRNNGRYELQMFEGGYYFEANGFMTESYFNPVDTCYEFILKLHELNML